MKHIDNPGGLKVTINPPTTQAAAIGQAVQTIQYTPDINLLNRGKNALNVTSIAILIPETFSTDIVLAPVSTGIWNFASTGVSGGYIASPSTGSISINASASIDLTLTVQVLNQAPGTVHLTAKVYFDEGDPLAFDLPVTVAPSTSLITSFSTESPDILPGTTATLTWVTTGIDHCIVDSFLTTPPNASGSIEVNPQFTTTYTLYAFAPGIILQAQLTVTVTSAYGELSPTSGLNETDYNSMVSLTWRTNAYTKSVNITCDDSSISIPSTLKNSDTMLFGPLTNTTQFTLNCADENPGSPDYDKLLEVIINPPVVNNFKASPDTGVWQGDAVTLSWEPVSVKSVIITTDTGLTLTTTDSSIVVKPEADTKYTLIATGANDANGQPMNTKPQVISLSVTQLKFNGFECDTIIPVIGGANQGTLTWNVVAQNISIDNGIGDVSGTTSHVLTAPADNSSYTITISTKQGVTKHQTITIINGYGPFIITGPTEPGFLDFNNYTTLWPIITPGMNALSNHYKTQVPYFLITTKGINTNPTEVSLGIVQYMGFLNYEVYPGCGFVIFEQNAIVTGPATLTITALAQ